VLSIGTDAVGWKVRHQGVTLRGTPFSAAPHRLLGLQPCTHPPGAAEWCNGTSNGTAFPVCFLGPTLAPGSAAALRDFADDAGDNGTGPDTTGTAAAGPCQAFTAGEEDQHGSAHRAVGAGQPPDLRPPTHRRTITRPARRTP
jgi:hypothetical protein